MLGEIEVCMCILHFGYYLFCFLFKMDHENNTKMHMLLAYMMTKFAYFTLTACYVCKILAKTYFGMLFKHNKYAF